MKERGTAVHAGAVLWTAVVILVTLTPGSVDLTPTGFCILCGERGLADAILNVALFLPLGVLGRRWGLGVWTLLLLGAGTSLCLEGAQFFIPGRDASPGDVVFNASGALLGALLTPRLAHLLRPTDEQAARLAFRWSVAFAAMVIAVACLLEPRLPEGLLELEVIPPAPEGGEFQGDVLEVRVGGDRVAERSVLPAERTLLPGADPIAVRFTPVEPRFSFRPLLGLLSRDASTRPFLFGPKGDAIVARLPRAASRARLTPADLELRAAFDATRVGDTLTAVIRRDGEAFCIGVDDRVECGFGHTAGSGWALLVPGTWGNGARDRWLDLVWLVAWAFPLGYWWRPDPRSGAAAVLFFGTVIAIPAVSGLMAAPLVTLGGTLGGWLAGFWFQGWLERRVWT